MKKKTMIRTPSHLHPPCSTCASSRTVSSSGEAHRTGHQHQASLPLRHQEPHSQRQHSQRLWLHVRHGVRHLVQCL